MRNIYVCMAILTVALIVLTGCKIKPQAENAKPLIITTIYPYELIVRELVDTLFTVQTLLPPNASPHNWSPNPRDIIDLNRADVVIANGLGLETNLAKTLEGLGNKVIKASDFVSQAGLVSEADETGPGNKVSNKAGSGSFNPHIWTSPDFLEAIIQGLATELGKRYPAHSNVLQARAAEMLQELKQTTLRIQAEREQYNAPSVVTLHDAFVYFFRYFKIDYIGSVEPSPGKDPTPRQLQALADIVQKKRIKAILIEPQQNPKPAETIATELHLKILSYDDLGTTLPAKTISDYLLQNWDKIKAGL